MSSNSISHPSLPPATSSDSVASPGDGKPIRRPDGFGAYRFVVVSALRAGQLLRGCTPKIDGHTNRATVIAQLEVASGRIREIHDRGMEEAGAVDE
jgi:DNA-directed RNA polymerase subunit K/omega